MGKKIYFISDSHVSYLLYANRPDIKKDTYRAVISVAEYIAADKNNTEAVVFCGDNFDSKSPCPSDLTAMQKAVSIMRDSGIRVLGIEGNHDKVAARKALGDVDDLSDEEILEMDDIEDGDRWIHQLDVEHINRRPIKLDCGLIMFGFDYIQGKSMFEFLENIPECDILVMHQPFFHISPFESNAIELSGLPDQIGKLVVAGHVHWRDCRCISPWKLFVSPGSTHSKKFKDPVGSFVSYDVETEEVKHIDTPVHRCMKYVEVFSESDYIAAENEVKEVLSRKYDEKPLIKISYTDDMVHNLKKLEEIIGDSAHIFKHVVASERAEVKMEKDIELTSAEILARVFDAMDLEQDDDLLRVAEAAVDGHHDEVFKYINKRMEKVI